MRLKIEGVRVFFTAIESFRFDQDQSALIVRTVSGVEYREAVKDAQQYEKLVVRIEALMALADGGTDVRLSV